MSAPVLILCPPRSFSSVVGTMLGQHPDLYGFPELSLFAAETVGELVDLLAARSPFPFRYPPGLLRSLAELHAGTQSEEEVERAGAWLDARQGWTTRRVLDHLLERVSPKIGVDKSPQTAISPEYLGRALRWYPKAMLLHLVRHPVTAIRSLQQHLAPGGSQPDECAAYWLYVHRNILKRTRRLPPGRLLRVRGEELLARPDDRLREIAAALRVPATTAAIRQMKHPERSPYARPGPRNAPLGNDPNFLSAPRLRRPRAIPPTLEKPREWRIHAGLWRRVVECARALGYREALAHESCF